MWSSMVWKTIWSNLKSPTSACRSWYHSKACTPTIGPCLKSDQWGSKTSFSRIGLTWKSIWTATMVTSSKRSLGINALFNDPRIVPTSPAPAPQHITMMMESITTNTRNSPTTTPWWLKPSPPTSLSRHGAVDKLVQHLFWLWSTGLGSQVQGEGQENIEGSENKTTWQKLLMIRALKSF